MDTSKVAILAISNKQAALQTLKQNCGRSLAIPDPLCIFNAEGQLVCAIKGNPSYGEEYESIGKTLHQLYAKEQADEFLVTFSKGKPNKFSLLNTASGLLDERSGSARIAPIQHEQVIYWREISRKKSKQKQPRF